MSVELVKALLTIVKFCVNNDNCKTCALKEFCGKIPTEW